MRVMPITPTAKLRNPPRRRSFFITKDGITYYVDEAQYIGIGIPQGYNIATAIQAAEYVNMLVVNGSDLMRDAENDFCRIYG